MARQARIVIPNNFHHIAQRGIEKSQIFFDKKDFQKYLTIIEEQSSAREMDIFSYCLFPNQIHILCVPKDKKDLSSIIGETNRQYTKYLNQKMGRVGSLFQNRFFSYAMDEPSALRAARFIETLPVTRELTPKPQNYLWSSAKFRIKNITASFLQEFRNFHTLQNWENFLERPMDLKELRNVQLHLQTGRPRGNDLFLDMVESEIGKSVRPKKRGRKPKKVISNVA